VLYLGAIGDRYGRKLLLVIGMALSIPASIVAGLAGSIEVLFGARLLGGVSAGMAYPTTLALITALWASGSPRTKAIALWSGIGGAISALGPLVSGALLEHFDWGSVFLITLPLALIALFLAVRFVPSHVNEASDPVAAGMVVKWDPTGPSNWRAMRRPMSMRVAARGLRSTWTRMVL